MERCDVAKKSIAFMDIVPHPNKINFKSVITVSQWKSLLETPLKLVQNIIDLCR